MLKLRKQKLLKKNLLHRKLQTRMKERKLLHKLKKMRLMLYPTLSRLLLLNRKLSERRILRLLGKSMMTRMLKKRD
jgi:hypothetical protein